MPTSSKFLITCGIALTALVLVQVPSTAHPGGHGTNNKNIRVWTLVTSQQTILGSFLFVKHDTVHIETITHKKFLVPLRDCSPTDREYIRGRAAMVTRINASTAPEGKAGAIPLFTATEPKQPTSDTFNIFTAFLPFAHLVSTRSDATWFYVASNGLPDHNMMVGIRSWQQQVPLPQAYSGTNSWQIPLHPVLAANPISAKTALFTGALALAINGVPIFNALNNRGDDAYLYGELDDWGGHCGRADDYHYHITPLHFENIVGKNKPLAVALDGYPIYGSLEPDSSAMQPLDSLNGHFYQANHYHYHGTRVYPYLNGGMRGTVTVQNDQIVPQPRATPARPWLQPLNGALITAFSITGPTSYSLQYKLNNQFYYVNYSYEVNGSVKTYIYRFVDPFGNVVTKTYRNGQLISATDDEMQLPDFSLEDNFPNPFNPQTAIAFTVATTTAVTITVYACTGEIVEELLHEVKSPGNYTVTWNASAYPSGIYFYTLRAGTFCATKKMLLLK